jgi:hypothetical protein
MCNAYNHSASCTCGWGEIGSTGHGVGARHSNIQRKSGYTFYSDSSYYDSLVRENLGNSVTYKTTCWYCGEEVFFHTNGYGDCVLFDQLGHPWEIHHCWKNYCLYSHNTSSIMMPSFQFPAKNFKFRR